MELYKKIWRREQIRDFITVFKYLQSDFKEDRDRLFCIAPMDEGKKKSLKSQQNWI